MREVAALVVGQYRAHELVADLESLLKDHIVSMMDDKKDIAKVASESLDRIAGKRELWKPSEDGYCIINKNS